MTYSLASDIQKFTRSIMNNKCCTMKYIPRNTTYKVSLHNIDIKDGSGVWLKGCVYEDINTGKFYARPYTMFDEESWVVLS